MAEVSRVAQRLARTRPTAVLSRACLVRSSTQCTAGRTAIAVSRRTYTTEPRSTSLRSSKRPTLVKEYGNPLVGLPLRVQGRRTIFIQTESTPNPDALKFLPGHPILPKTLSSPFIEYLTPRSTLQPPHPSPLAARLLNVDGVTSVFYGSDFITVTKSSEVLWPHIKPEVFSLITEAVTSGETIVETRGHPTIPGAAGEGEQAGEADSLGVLEDDSEVVGMIKELLETRIRPAIQEDGGDIEFRGFNEETGEVMLKLRGACRTCDSSTVTLKNGIESMLMHYIEEVQSVVQVLDQEEEIAMAEFQKFEERLRSTRGAEA